MALGRPPLSSNNLLDDALPLMFPLVTPVTGVDAASDDAREVGVEVKGVFTGVVVAGVVAVDDFTGDSGILICASFDLLLSIAVVAFVVVVKFCLLLLLLDVSEDVVVDTVIEFVTPPELLLLLLTAVVGVVVIGGVLLLVITAAELTTGVTVISRVIVGAAVVETEDCNGCTAKLVIASNGFGGGCKGVAVDSGPEDSV